MKMRRCEGERTKAREWIFDEMRIPLAAAACRGATLCCKLLADNDGHLKV